jgi:GT2 family glycosyltransferase
MTPDHYTILFGQPAMRAFFEKVPWTLSGSIQNKNALRKALVNEASRFTTDSNGPKFSLISPMYNTEPAHLQELIWSCQLQTWGNWELLLYDDCSPKKEHLPLAESAARADRRIKFIRGEVNKGISGARNAAIAQASGDFICVMDHDDLLHPQTLGIYMRLLADDPGVNFLFCNEVKVSNDGNILSDFYSKPGFSFATLLRTNYICHFTAVRRDLLFQARSAKGEFFIPAYDGFEDHNLFIRLAELPDFRPRHTPVFGYYWRKATTSTATEVGVKPDIWKRDRAMLAERLPVGTDIAITGERGSNGLHSIFMKAPSPADITVIVPYRERPDMTLKCLTALEAQVTATPLQVVLVDNDSKDPATAHALERWTGESRKHRYKLTHDAGPFNYAAINNKAASQHGGAEFLVFLNNDVELQSPNALAVMAAELQHRPEIAVCGLRLEYPGGKGLQHGGMGLRADPARLLAPRHLNGPRDFVHDEHKVFAVTFACAMVRRTAFEQVGGFDAVFFANGLSDVDLCCRLIRAGYEIFYFGTLSGIHHESASRETQTEDFEIQMLNEKHADILQAGYIRQYGYDHVLPAGAGAAWFEVPLRYKVADALNDRMKTLLGPVHSTAKKLMKRPRV